VLFYTKSEETSAAVVFVFVTGNLYLMLSMSLNGPIKMYKIRPLYDFVPDIILPTCMYKTKNVYGETGSIETVVYKEDDLNLLEMEKHQLNIIQKLEDLKEKVLKLKDEFGIQTQAPVDKFQDIVIKANPASPPLSLWVFYHILSQTMPVRLVSYIHSSLVEVPNYVNKLQNLVSSEPCKVSLTIVWRHGNEDHEMVIDPVNQGRIEGEVNIARYIARLLCFNYETDPILSTQIDDWLEAAHSSIIHGSNKERQSVLKSLNSHLGKKSYLVGNSASLADIIIWSALVQTKLHKDLPANISRWYKGLLNNEMFAYSENLADFVI